MPAKRKPREFHMYSVWVEMVREDGTIDSQKLYFDSNERQAQVIFACYCEKFVAL